MADTYTLHIAGLTRELPICKVNDHMDIAAFIMFSDVGLTEACAAALLKKAPEFDVILTAEAKGHPTGLRNGTSKRQILDPCPQRPEAVYARARHYRGSVHHHHSASRCWSSIRRISSIWTASAS